MVVVERGPALFYRSGEDLPTLNWYGAELWFHEVVHPPGHDCKTTR